MVDTDAGVCVEDVCAVLDGETDDVKTWTVDCTVAELEGLTEALT